MEKTEEKELSFAEKYYTEHTVDKIDLFYSKFFEEFNKIFCTKVTVEDMWQGSISLGEFRSMQTDFLTAKLINFTGE